MSWRRSSVLVLVLAVAGCRAGGESGETRPEPPPTTAALPSEAAAGDVLLVWVPGGLPDGFADRVRALPAVRDLTVVLGDIIPLAGVVDGFDVPVEAIALDCETWATFEPEHAEALCRLRDDEVLLGATGALLRDGDALTLGSGRRLRVVGTVPDEAVGAAELVLPAAGAAAGGIRVPRYLLLHHEGSRPELEAAIRAAAPEARMRVRVPGEVTFLRHADVVLPQSLLKRTFGEFGSRPSGTRLELDPAWTTEHLVAVDLPVVGVVTCHEAIVPALRGALTDIAERGLVPEVDRAATGCWNPRPIAGTDQPSRHAWGAALDIVPAPTDPQVVEVFDRWGFTWGGEWLTPDPVHFEYVRPPRRSPAAPAAR